MTKSQGRYSDSDLGKAIRFLLKGRSISYVSIDLDRREENIRKKFLEIRDAIDDVLSEETPTLFDDNFKVDESFLTPDERVEGQYFEKQTAEYVQEYLTKKKMAHQIVPEEKKVLIYKSQSRPKKAYSYYYETGEWIAPTGKKGKVYPSRDIEQFINNWYKSAEDDQKYWEEKEAEELRLQQEAEQLKQKASVDQNVTKIDLTESDMNFLQKLFSKKKAQYE